MANDQVQNLPNHRYWPKQGRDFAGTHQFSMANKKVLKLRGVAKTKLYSTLKGTVHPSLNKKEIKNVNHWTLQGQKRNKNCQPLDSIPTEAD